MYTSTCVCLCRYVLCACVCLCRYVLCAFVCLHTHAVQQQRKCTRVLQIVATIGGPEYKNIIHNKVQGNVSIIELRRYILFISTGLKAVLGQYDLFTDRNTRDHLAWTIGNGDSMHGMCIPHKIPRAWEQQG